MVSVEMKRCKRSISAVRAALYRRTHLPNTHVLLSTHGDLQKAAFDWVFRQGLHVPAPLKPVKQWFTSRIHPGRSSLPGDVESVGIRSTIESLLRRTII